MSQYGSMVGLADLLKVISSSKNEEEKIAMAKMLGYEKTETKDTSKDDNTETNKINKEEKDKE